MRDPNDAFDGSKLKKNSLQGLHLVELSWAIRSRCAYNPFRVKESISHVFIAQEIIKVAFENGINMFDTAEAYAAGRSELEM